MDELNAALKEQNDALSAVLELSNKLAVLKGESNAARKRLQMAEQNVQWLRQDILSALNDKTV